ncbi:MAG: SDR family NAD(P)-dependent oxidoreductase, partial [Pseudonocardiaceae bacterium]
MDLANKVALVTGGSRGIGAATARALAANDVKVAVNGRDQAAIDGVVGELNDAGGTAIGVAADVCDWSAIEAMRKRVEDELGPVDVLVPFAGGFGGRTPVQEISEDEWHSVIESNLTSTFLTVKSFVPGMIERRSGSIVTMASNAARFLDITLTASYAAAKAGIAMF